MSSTTLLTVIPPCASSQDDETGPQNECHYHSKWKLPADVKIAAEVPLCKKAQKDKLNQQYPFEPCIGC